LKEFEIEMERLSSRIEHLKSQNEVLSLTLAESKNHCDNITVLIGEPLTLVLGARQLMGITQNDNINSECQ
jgi:PDZ domain of MCC-2 bdg protein for Usher syndrome